jgi:hypothetical protein
MPCRVESFGESATSEASRRRSMPAEGSSAVSRPARCSKGRVRKPVAAPTSRISTPSGTSSSRVLPAVPGRCAPARSRCRSCQRNAPVARARVERHPVVVRDAQYRFLVQFGLPVHARRVLLRAVSLARCCRTRRCPGRPPSRRAPPRCGSADCTWQHGPSEPGAPVLICPAFTATAMSAMVVSSVSPERCEITHV